jgi:predicted RNase H-like HicB family nuclease
LDTLQIAEHDAVAAVAQRGQAGSPLARYIKAAMQHETYQQAAADQPWYGGLAGLPDLHSQAATRSACRVALQTELESWLLAQIAEGLPVPPVNSVPLTEWIAIKRGS